jgi:hypothetical protein
MFIAINTQPLIAQPVNALARFMTTANAELYVLAKGVLRYLKGVKSRKIVWCASHIKFPFVSCELYAYSDASWADIVPQRKSSLTYLIFCNNAVFSWKASLSSVPAMSSAEAELIALCSCTADVADVAYCRKLANELGFLQLRPTVIHEDNLGAKQIAQSGNFKGRSKHFELCWRFLHHYINWGIVSIKAIKRDLQLADIGTPPLWERVFPSDYKCSRKNRAGQLARNAFFHRTTNAAGKIEPDDWPVQSSGSIFPAAFVVRWKNAFPHPHAYPQLQQMGAVIHGEI